MSIKFNKIFCIGLMKTGTTSITKALNLLGYKIVHRPIDKQFISDIKQGKFKNKFLDSVDGISDMICSKIGRAHV